MKHMRRNALLRTLTHLALGSLIFAVAPHPTRAQVGSCMSLESVNGPYDYRDNSPTVRNLLRNVHLAHFRGPVLTLERGITSVHPGDDLDFTLRHFPNHPRALATMIKLAKKKKTDKPRGAKHPVICYVDRAVVFRPDDVDVRLIAASFYAERGRVDVAKMHVERAEALAENSPQVHYNLGLLHFDLKQYESAMKSARIAYEGGITLPGLRKKLISVGKWQSSEPSPAKPDS